MKLKIGHYVLVDGEIGKVIGNNNGNLTWWIHMEKPKTCENCGHVLGVDKRDFNDGSPNMKESVKPVPTPNTDMEESNE